MLKRALYLSFILFIVTVSSTMGQITAGRIAQGKLSTITGYPDVSATQGWIIWTGKSATGKSYTIGEPEGILDKILRQARDEQVPVTLIGKISRERGGLKGYEYNYNYIDVLKIQLHGKVYSVPRSGKE